MKRIKSKIILISILTFSLVYAQESDYSADVYDIRGAFVGTIQLSDPIENLQIRLLSPTTLMSKNGEQNRISAGIYFFTPPNFVMNSEDLSFREFGFEDVTEEYLPLEEWDAGDIETADINGDGLIDIVFSIYYYDENLDSRPRIWIQTSEGNFVDETDSRIPDLQAPCYDIELFDVDNDSDIDIFLTGYFGNEYYFPAGLLINDGTGYFSDESTERLPQFNYPDFAYFAEAASIDNNQSVDLIVNVFEEPDTTSYQIILPQIWLNDGDGYFVQDTLGRLPSEIEYGFFEIATTDIDMDNNKDIIFANIEMIIYDAYGNVIDTLSGQNACYYNTGDGFFSDETELRIPEEDDPFTRDLAISDIDNDGDLDILEVGFGFDLLCQQVRLLSNDGNGYYSVSYNSLPYLSGWFNDSQFGLLDDDEFPDLFMIKVLLGEPSYDILLLNNGDGTFSDNSYLLPPICDFSVSCELFDHQIDSDVDIIISNSGNIVGLPGQNVLYQNTLNTSSIDDDNSVSNKFYILQNNPNPFNSKTSISYYLPESSNVKLQIYNIKGQLVRTLINRPEGIGYHTIQCDAKDFNSGIYFYKITLGGYSDVKKCLKFK
ncbi:MAG: T9SS type A sorting domain-containing protein [Candidatus Cloacimonetes bacterium]|nr:T9SS type A sorting domain-containing protein [Candidatus Cloacimonadota bacterium]